MLVMRMAGLAVALVGWPLAVTVVRAKTEVQCGNSRVLVVNFHATRLDYVFQFLQLLRHALNMRLDSLHCF